MNKLLSICWLVFVQWPRGLWLHTRLVLVEGLSSAEAARRVGITTQGANQAVQRCRRVIELAKVVGR